MGGGEINVSSSVGNQEFSGLKIGLYTNNECLSVPIESVLEEPVISGAEASAWLNKLEGNGVSFEEDELFGQPLVMGLSGGATAPDGSECFYDLINAISFSVVFFSQLAAGASAAVGPFKAKDVSELIKIEGASAIIFAFFEMLRRIMTKELVLENGRPEGSLLQLWQWAFNSCGRPGSGLPKKVKDWVVSHIPQPVMLPEPAPVAPMVAATAGATLLVIGAKQTASLLGTLQSGGVFLLEGTAVVGSSLLVPIILLPDESSSSNSNSL